MLNPGFKLLDPDPSFSERLQALMPLGNGLDALEAISDDLLQKHKAVLNQHITRAGIVTQAGLWPVLQALEPDLAGKELTLMGLPLARLAPLYGSVKEPLTMLLGILTGEEIWTGMLAGVSEGSLDFLATLQWLWQEEPELASKQTLQDFAEWRQAVVKRFGRKTVGLFIYLNEFKQWQQHGFARTKLNEFIGQQTAVLDWL